MRILSPAVPAKSPQNLVPALPSCLTVLYLAVGCLATDFLGVKKEIIEQQGLRLFYFFFGEEEEEEEEVSGQERTNGPRR